MTTPKLPRALRRLTAIPAILALAAAALTQAAPQAAAAPAAHAAAVPNKSPVVTEARALATAHKTHRRVPVPSLTTSTSTTTANPDGTLTLSQSIAPVRAYSDGAWRNLSADLHKTAGGRLTPALSAVPLSLSGGGSGPLAVMTVNLRSLSLSWPGTLPVPVVSGPTATYAGVLPGVDLVLTAGATGALTETIVVHNAAAAANPALASLQLGLATTGLTMSVDSAGNFAAAAGPGLAPLISAPPPLMWDSAPPPAGMATATGPGGATVGAQSGLPAYSSVIAPGAGAHVTSVPVSLAAGALKLSPSAAALTGPNVTYPVYIDPTLYPKNSLGPVASSWTQVDSGFPTTSYWKESSELQAGECDFSGCNGLGVARSFFTMPLNSLLKGAYIGNANIDMNDVWSANGCTAEPVYLYATGGINSGTDWNNQPAWNTKVEEESFAFGSSGCGSKKGDVDWGTGSPATGGTSAGGLHDLIQADVNKASPPSTMTFGLRAVSETNDLQWKQFASGAANITMTITYDLPPQAPSPLSIDQSIPTGCQPQSSPAAIGDDDVTFRAPTSDLHTKDNMTNTITIHNASGSTAKTGTMTGTINGSGTATFGQTAAQMQALNGTASQTQQFTYYWQAQSDNEYGHAGPLSKECWFTYNPAGPGKPNVTIPASATWGTSFNITISPPDGCGTPTSPCPTSYTYQIGAGPYGTLAAASGTVAVTMNQVGPVGITVTGFASGNPSTTPYTGELDGTPPATPFNDGYIAGGQYPSLLTLHGASTSTPAVLLSPGTGNGTLGPAISIGSLGTGANPGSDGPADWEGDILAHGNFLTSPEGNVQDILAYNPSSTAGDIIEGTETTATLPAEVSLNAAILNGQLANNNLNQITQVGDSPAQPNNSGVTPASQLVGAGNASGIGTGTDDLIGIAGTAASHDFELDLYTDGQCGGCAAGSPTFLATLSITSPDGITDGNSWGNYSLATVQAGSRPGGTPNPEAVTLFALNTTNGQLYQAPTSPLSQDQVTGAWTVSPLTWTPVTTTWGTTPPTLVSADITNSGSTELWTESGTTATAYTLTGASLTKDSTTNPVVPGHNWPLTDGQVASTNGASPPATATDLLANDPATLTAGTTWDPQSSDEYLGGDIILNGSSGYLYPAANTVATTDSTPTLSLWFNTTSTSGGILASLQAAALPGGPGTVANYDPVMYIGTNGDLYAEFWDGTNHPIATSFAVNNGAWHHAVLFTTGSGSSAVETLYVDGTAVSTTLTGAISLASSTTTGGNTNLTFGNGYIGGKWPSEPHFVATGGAGSPGYYFSGQLADITYTP